MLHECHPRCVPRKLVLENFFFEITGVPTLAVVSITDTKNGSSAMMAELATSELNGQEPQVVSLGFCIV